MKDTPTSGPIVTSKTHHARETMSSRHSLSRSHKNGDLGERKKHLFKILKWTRGTVRCGQHGEFRNGAFATHATVTEQHEPVAQACRLADLMNGEEQRASACRVRSEGSRDVACRAQVEPIETLVA